jgi:hypothetical protein
MYFLRTRQNHPFSKNGLTGLGIMTTKLRKEFLLFTIEKGIEEFTPKKRLEWSS